MLMQPADAMLPPRFPPLQRRKITTQPPPPVHKKPFNPSHQSVKYKEWMSPEILQLIKEKERAYSLWKKSKASPTEVESLRLKYRTISNMYTAKKRIAQRQLEENCSAKSTENTDETTAANVTIAFEDDEVVSKKVNGDAVMEVIKSGINSELSVNVPIETENVGLKDSMGRTDETANLSCTTKSTDSSNSVPSALEVPTRNGSDPI